MNRNKIFRFNLFVHDHATIMELILTKFQSNEFFFLLFSFSLQTICSWDEWVLEDRVLKYNDANVQKQKEVSKQHATTSAKNKKGASANIGNVLNDF